MSGYTTSTNLQEVAQKIANSIAVSLNSVASSIIGTDIMYFKAVPVGEETDFLFHDYTLYNVEPCPMTFKAVYVNTSYDESNYVFSQLGMDYQSPLELEIDISTWNNVTGNKGEEPRAGDIIYIPLTNKLLEVSSMNPGKTSGQVTTYKVSCKKYQPSKHRYVGGALAESIESNTTNTEKQYGEEIKEMVQNLVNDAQTSPYTISPTTDEYRNIAKSKDPNSTSILNNSKVNCIKDFEPNFTVDSHLVAKYYYDNNITNNVVVEYKSPDEYIEEDFRSLSIWFNIQSPTSKKYKVDSITVEERKGKFTNIRISVKTDLNDKFVIVERGSIKLYGTVKNNIISLPNNLINKLPDNWTELSGFTIYENKPNNILSWNGDNSGEINLVANKFIQYILNDNIYTIDLGKSIDYNHWYGLIINLNKKLSYSLFDNSPKLNLIKEGQGPIEWVNNSIYNYFIKSSEMFMTNIRLYNTENSNLSSQLQDLVTYNIPNASKAIINDSADKYLDFEYFRKTR